MRRMVNINKIIKKPVICNEEDIVANSEFQVELAKGDYLIDLHQDASHCVAFLTVCDEDYAVSTATMFNASITGAALGCYHYDNVGHTIQILDGSENIINVTGHLDIYRF